MIEDARQKKLLTNDQARAASVALGLEGDEAMLASRLMSGGADPASLQYLERGSVSEKVALAHYAGPGVFTADDPEREDYLGLCALSADESQRVSLRERVNHYVESLSIPIDVLPDLARDELASIMSLPFSTVTLKDIGGDNHLGEVSLRVYKSDRGFANAYWSGVAYAAVYFDGEPLSENENERPYLYVCTNGSVGVESLGLPLDKVLDDNRGIISSGGTVSYIMERVAL
jgi:hypothetical protein